MACQEESDGWFHHQQQEITLHIIKGLEINRAKGWSQPTVQVL